jgi:hypothetical protein
MLKRRSIALSVIVSFAIGTVGFADPPTVSIQQQAELFRGFGGAVLGIVVHVVVHCGDGETTLGGLAVAARQGDLADGNVDGIPGSDRQEVEVFVPGTFFVPGDAQASAVLQCGPLLAGEDLGRTIRIVEP